MAEKIGDQFVLPGFEEEMGLRSFFKKEWWKNNPELTTAWEKASNICVTTFSIGSYKNMNYYFYYSGGTEV